MQKFRQQQRQILSELKQPGIPDSEDCENPIDAFLEIRYQERKVQPEEKCDDATFLRRAYLDAIGCCLRRMNYRVFTGYLIGQTGKTDRLSAE